MTDQPDDPRTPDDSKSVNVAIGVAAGQVVIEYEQPRKRVVYDPENCRMVAEQMARAAYEAHTGRKADTGASALTDAIHERLVRRVSLALRSMALDGKSNGQIARKLIEIIAREVT